MFYYAAIHKEEKTFIVYQIKQKIILEGDFAQSEAGEILDNCFKVISGENYPELIIDLRNLGFINLAAIKSIIRFVITKEEIKFVFIADKYKEWQDMALRSLSSLGNACVSHL